MNLIAADGVLGVGFQPESYRPLIQTERRIFHDRPRLQCELTAGVTAAALVAAVLGEVSHVGRPAVWAVCPFRPTHGGEVGMSLVQIGEELDGFHERSGSLDRLAVCVVHVRSLRRMS